MQEAGPAWNQTLYVVKVFFWSKQSPALLKLQSLAGCLGIHVEAIDLAKDGDLHLASLKSISQTKCGIVLDVASMTNAYNKEELEGLAARLRDLEMVVLLLVSNVEEFTARFLKILTNNAIRGIAPVEQADRVELSR